MRTKEPTKIGLVQEVLRGDFYRVSIGEQEGVEPKQRDYPLELKLSKELVKSKVG